ncbi:MAG: YdcF family protein [Arachnia sp.]
MTASRAVVIGAVAAGAACVIAVEAAHLRARLRLPDATPDASVVVLVLGCPALPDGSLHPTQRWRVERAALTFAHASTVIFSGAAVHGAVTEADTMADYARSLGLDEARIVRERHARTTAENITCSLPWLAQAQQIIVVSDELHAARAIRTLREVLPEARVVRIPGYRIGSGWRRKALSAMYESPAGDLLRAWRRARHGRGRRRMWRG